MQNDKHFDFSPFVSDVSHKIHLEKYKIDTTKSIIVM